MEKVLKIGDKIYVEFGNAFIKAKVIAKSDDDFLLKETAWLGSGLKIRLGQRKWFTTLLSKSN